MLMATTCWASHPTIQQPGRHEMQWDTAAQRHQWELPLARFFQVSLPNELMIPNEERSHILMSPVTECSSSAAERCVTVTFHYCDSHIAFYCYSKGVSISPLLCVTHPCMHQAHTVLVCWDGEVWEHLLERAGREAGTAQCPVGCLRALLGVPNADPGWQERARQLFPV